MDGSSCQILKGQIVKTEVEEIPWEVRAPCNVFHNKPQNQMYNQKSHKSMTQSIIPRNLRKYERSQSHVLRE